MAKYLINSNDVEIEEVSGTENLKLNLAPGNSVEQMIGDLSNLTTTSKSNIVNALNEVNGNLGNLANLNTPNKDNLVNAINGIVESGNNSNGNYVKYFDGTMICYNTQLFSGIDCSTQWGGIYTNSNDKRNFNNFPVSFIEEPKVTMRLVTGNADGWVMSANINGGPSTTFPGGWQMCRGTSNNSCDIYVSYIAIGKWK